MDYLVPTIIFEFVYFFCPPTKSGQLVPYNNTILIMYFPNITRLWSIYPDLVPNLCHQADENFSWPSMAEWPRESILMVFWKKDRKWFRSEFWVESWFISAKVVPVPSYQEGLCNIPSMRYLLYRHANFLASQISYICGSTARTQKLLMHFE